VWDGRRPPDPVFGRDAAVARVIDQIDRVGRSFIVVGPPGVGKTAIIRAALQALAAGKHVVCEKPLVGSLAEADETRRSMGSPGGQDDVRAWFYPAALARGYDLVTVERVWEVLRAFASFGFCKAHAAAFALPTYQSAWFKAHHPAAFLAGILTHDPGMYPKRLILDDARHCGIAVLGLDVNDSGPTYTIEKVASAECHYGIRLSLADVKGMSEAEMERIVDKPVIAINAATWWMALRDNGVDDRLHGFGTLLREY